MFGYDPGTAAGLIAGSLTESAAIGTAMDAISKLDAPEAAREAMANNIAVAFAVTYLVGVIGAAWVLSQLAPKLLRINLADECRKLEESMQGGGLETASARREFELRAYELEPGSPWVGRSVADFEAAGGGTRVFIERVRSRGEILEGDLRRALRAGDTLAVSGPRTTLVEVLEAPGSGLREVDDRDLLDLTTDLVDVVVTNEAIDGLTLAELGREQAVRGVFLRRHTRAGTPLGILPSTKVDRGDVLTVVGTVSRVGRAVEFIGVADRATDVTDMLVVAAGIVAGALIGLPALHIGGVEIGLSLPVGVLLGGLVCGWMRSVRPRWFGRIPSPTLWVFESIGLTGFVAVVGLNAGPDFVRGLQASGDPRDAALTITVSLLTDFAHYEVVFAMIRACCRRLRRACTATPALAAVQEAARSSVPSMDMESPTRWQRVPGHLGHGDSVADGLSGRDCVQHRRHPGIPRPRCAAGPRNV
jgi:putative transport protein